MVVRKREQKARGEREMTLTWLAAAWSRQDRAIPSLKDVLGRQQTAEEQRAIWRQAADVFGFKVKRHNKRKARIIRMPARKPA